MERLRGDPVPTVWGFLNQKWGRGRNYSCLQERLHSRDQCECCPSSWASHLSQIGLVLPPPEHLLGASLSAWKRELEELWVVARVKSERAWEEEVGEGSHNWEDWGYHGQDVTGEENPNIKETKPHWCSYLWDDLLNSHNLLPVGICRGTSTRKHCFEIKEELEGKRHKLWSSDNTHELDKLIVMSVSWILYLWVKN